MFNAKEWCENDYNPFIVFDYDGKIVYFNYAAEMLLNFINKKELFDIVLHYSPENFGYKTVFFDLKFNHFKFYGATIGYNNEENIAIKLYLHPGELKSENQQQIAGEKSNIYLLIDISICIIKSNNNIEFKNIFDPTIEEFFISQNEFVALLRKVYEAFLGSKKITTILKLKIGKSILINRHKHQLIELIISGDLAPVSNKASLVSLAKKLNINIEFFDNHILLDIPFISHP